MTVVFVEWRWDGTGQLFAADLPIIPRHGDVVVCEGSHYRIIEIVWVVNSGHQAKIEVRCRKEVGGA